MKKKLNDFWGSLFVITFGAGLLMGFVYVCEFAAWHIFGLPMMRLPFFLVAGVFIYAGIRHTISHKPST